MGGISTRQKACPFFAAQFGVFGWRHFYVLNSHGQNGTFQAVKNTASISGGWMGANILLDIAAEKICAQNSENMHIILSFAFYPIRVARVKMDLAATTEYFFQNVP